jgi:hypothetical protein
MPRPQALIVLENLRVTLDAGERRSNSRAIQVPPEIHPARRIREMVQSRHAIVQPHDTQENAGVNIRPRDIAIPSPLPRRLTNRAVRVDRQYPGVRSHIEPALGGGELRKRRAAHRLLVQSPGVRSGRIRQLVNDGLLLLRQLMRQIAFRTHQKVGVLPQCRVGSRVPVEGRSTHPTQTRLHGTRQQIDRISGSIVRIGVRPIIHVPRRTQVQVRVVALQLP